MVSAQDVANRALDGWHSHLGTFYRRRVQRYSLELYEALFERRERCGFDIEVDEITLAMCLDLLRRMATASQRTLIKELHVARHYPAPATSAGTERFEAFSRWLEDGADDLLADYPVLRDDLDRLHRAGLDGVLAAVDRYAQDAASLRSAGLLDSDLALTGITATDADSHNGGQRVMVMVAGRRSVVYKPRSLAPECYFSDLASIANAELEPHQRLRIVRSIDRGTYGWQEFVRDCPFETASQVSSYYEGLGAASVFFAAFTVGDLHFENIFATGHGPVFFDLEAFAEFESQSPASAQNRLYLEMLRESPLSTLIVPSRQLDSPFDIDLAGIGTVDVSTSRLYSTYQLLDVGTDKMRLGRVATKVVHSTNLVRLGGTIVDPVEYEEQFAEGMAAMHGALAATWPRLLDMAASAPRHLSARRVMRPTASYARLLEAASHPDYLQTDQQRAELFGMLRPQRGIPEEHGNRIRQAEIDSLLRGDVPYFTCPWHSDEIIADAQTPVARTGLVPTGQRMLERVRAYSQHHDCRRDRDHLRVAFQIGRPKPWARADRSPGAYLRELFADPDPRTVAGRLAEHLAATGRWSDDGSVFVRMTAALGGDDRLAATGGKLTFYEDGGTALFLLMASAALGDPDSRAVGAGLLQPIRDLDLERIDPATGDRSAYAGDPSVAMTAMLGGRLLGDPSLVALGIQLLERLASSTWRDYEKATDEDLIGGRSGLILALSAAPELPAQELMLRHEVDRLLTHLPAWTSVLPDLAHGLAGAVVALAATATCLDDDTIRGHAGHQADRLLGMVTDGGDLDLSWCRGLSGVVQALALVSRAGCLDESGAARSRRLARGWMARLRREPTVDLSYCHGASGRIDAALDAARYLQLPEAVDDAHDLWDSALRSAASDGYSLGLARSAGHAGYLLGLGGVGALAVRLADPDCGSLTRFELAGNAVHEGQCQWAVV